MGKNVHLNKEQVLILLDSFVFRELMDEIFFIDHLEEHGFISKRTKNQLYKYFDKLYPVFIAD